MNTVIENRITEIEAIDPEVISENLLKLITDEFEKTESNELRHAIIIKMYDVGELGKLQVDVNAVIRTIARLIDSNYIGTLVWFCSHYDCTEDIELFTRIVIEHDTIAYIEAVSVFEAMQDSISPSVKNSVIAKLHQYNSTLAPDHFKKEIMPELIGLIEEFPVSE